jgi:hypothetical protein
VLSAPDFDATTIDTSDLSRLRFGDVRLSGRVVPEKVTLEDVNKDGSLDLLLFVSSRAIHAEGALISDSTVAELTGFTNSGQFFRGTDTVSIVPNAPAGTLVLEPGQSFTNGNLSNDVNNDGYVSPRDALLLINALNAGGSRPLEGVNLSGSNMDVNGDHYLSPRDALLVINCLNAPLTAGDAEGEEASADLRMSSTGAGRCGLAPLAVPQAGSTSAYGANEPGQVDDIWWMIGQSDTSLLDNMIWDQGLSEYLADEAYDLLAV